MPAPAQISPTSAKTLSVNPPPDRHEQQERNLYSTPYHSIIFRNFLAGAARALGGIILYILFILFLGWLANTYLLPQLQPIFSAFETINQLKPGTSGSPGVSPAQLEMFMQQTQTPPPAPN